MYIYYKKDLHVIVVQIQEEKIYKLKYSLKKINII